MKKHEIDVASLDDLCFRMLCGIKTLGAVHGCIESGDCATEDYTDALYGALDHLWDLNTKLRELIDGPACEVAGKAVKV